MKLAIENKHPRDDRIEFDEEPHLYYIDGSTDGYISVTTLIHDYFEKFDADKVIEKMMKSPNWTRSQYYGISPPEIKSQWEEHGDECSRLGTITHNDIEKFYNGVTVQNNTLEFEYFLKFYERNPELRPYRTEWTVFDERLKLAGSIDMLFIDDNGDYHIYDWKRSKSIKKHNKYQKGLYPLSHLDDCNFNHYSLQLNIYRKLLKLNYGIDVKSMCLIQLHPDWKTYIKYECPILDSEVDLLFAERIIRLSKPKTNQKLFK